MLSLSLFYRHSTTFPLLSLIGYQLLASLSFLRWGKASSWPGNWPVLDEFSHLYQWSAKPPDSAPINCCHLCIKVIMKDQYILQPEWLWRNKEIISHRAHYSAWHLAEEEWKSALRNWYSALKYRLWYSSDVKVFFFLRNTINDLEKGSVNFYVKG